ncbi:protein FAM161A isoform X1 [Alligator mississippiensis]|uniref:Protein FAM161A n=1 Tax=Alligator mississippiensis TaxID=8496 RepID=A0A151MGL0_ALLMI|nr:protein FAM161A isoform X1 [Alligator mississippiensis]KYO23648.1 protein FAM161A isoform A [Alligator mississippiensis]
MDAAHRAALLVASCLHTPVNARTRAPAALYERQQGPVAAEEQDGFDLYPEPEKEQNSSLNTDCEDWIDFPKMCRSNQEYYLKLEELKKAHLETMAKLEIMYRHKLHVKGVHPLGNTDAVPSICHRSTWEKSSFHPLNLQKSFSEPDLNNPFNSSSSGESDEELELEEENISETGSQRFAKEQIEKMWDGFSVEDYIPQTKHSLSDSLGLKTRRQKQKEWSPQITVPKPFQMTIREARKKQQNVKSKSQIEMENNLLKKQLEEEAECQKKFRANPVPASVFLPLYQEIMEQNEERRKSVKERSRNILLAYQRPFKFIEREEQRKEIRKMQLKDLSLPEKKTKFFKAKPVPKSVYSPDVNDKLKEEELYREIRIRMRAEELLRNSSLPNSRLADKADNKQRKQKCTEQKELVHKPRIKTKIPNFETLHQKFQKQLLQQKHVKHITVCEPFNLHTPHIPSNKWKILKDIQTDEEKLKETRWPYTSPRCKPRRRCSSANSHLLGCEESKSPRITEFTKRRVQAIRMHEKQRMQEYLQAMEEMEERVNQRPLLLERVTQKNARIAAEKHYSDILKELRLCEDFISKKGQTPKLLYPSSDEDFKRYTEDRESLNEDKIQERESCKEEEPSPQSDQSCEEEAGMRHQSDQSCEEEEEKASCQSHQFCDGEEEASHQSHQSEEEEQVEVASTLSDHDALKYKDEKYEECGSEEKPSDNEAD